MAHIQYTALVAGIRGKMNGSYFSQRADQSGRGTISAKPTTARKIKYTDAVIPTGGHGSNSSWRNMQTQSQQWSGLSDEDKASWNAAAPSVPHKNKFGIDTVMSGFQYFMQYRMILKSLGLAVSDAAPVPTEVVDASGYTGLGNVEDGVLNVAQNSVTPVIQYMVLFMAPQRNASRARRQKGYVYMGKALGNNVSGVDAWNAYVARFGTPVADNAIDFIAYQVNSETAQQGVVSTGTIIVAAS